MFTVAKMNVAGKDLVSSQDASFGDMKNGILTSNSRGSAVDSADEQLIGQQYCPRQSMNAVAAEFRDTKRKGAMTTFTFWKGVADAATGIILLTKPEMIYHSSVAKILNRLSGLRLPNPHPTAEGEVSSQHAIAIMVIAIGLGHIRASQDRNSIPVLVVMNAAWSALALGTVLLKPHRATSALLMTGINHFIFASVMFLRSKMTFKELLGQQGSKSKRI
ncbi:hypothetical protein OPT61_g951 [Boeremia exigua]|uniref:Uncharacterized protein n=1 Tax=Boeremia exigua TaxID=749465 RepID=A0ACC2IRZ2_9PLEO|nr:hypothetical protein OPT61_g951 [Boeremia exigua]